MNDAQWDVWLRREIKRQENRETGFKLTVWASMLVACLLIWWTLISLVIKLWRWL